MADDILKTLIAEAMGEGPEGMRLVAETILNRAAIRGLSPEEVVRQPKQYTGLGKPGPEAKKAWNNPEAIAAAQAAWELAQQPGDPTGGADHYYAPGTISQPWWAGSMTPKGEYGGHAFYASRPIPPGELPEVATALATVPTPRNAPAPVTPSVDLAMYRRNVAPSQLVPDTFAGLNKPRRNLGDELAMSPIQGGRQQAPMFDAAFDERTGTMRLTREPMDTQGMYVGRSREPAPVPAMPSPQLAGRRATDPTLQAALNDRYQAKLPPLPPPSTLPARPSNLDVARSEQAAQRNVARRPQNMQASPSATIDQMYAGIYPTEPGQYRIGSTDGLGPGNPAGRVSTAVLTGEVNATGLPTTAPFTPPPVPFARPTQFAQAPRIAPVPFQRPTAVGSALSVTPAGAANGLPASAPSGTIMRGADGKHYQFGSNGQWMTTTMTPMPMSQAMRPGAPSAPMPIPRPAFGMGGGERPAPVPASMSPFLAMRRSIPSLPSLRPATSPAARRVWMSGFSDSESSGGAHGGSSD